MSAGQQVVDFFESNPGEGSVTNNGVLPTSVSTDGGLFSVDFSAMRLGGEGEELRFNLLVDGALAGKTNRSFSDGNLVWNEVLDLAPGVHTIGIQSLNAAGSVGLFDADLDVIRYNEVAGQQAVSFFESNPGEGSVTNNGVLPTSVSTDGGLFSVDFSAMRLGGDGEELRFNLLVDGALTGKSFRSFSDGNLVWNEVLDLAPGVHTIGIQSLNAAGSVGLFDADLDVIRYNEVAGQQVVDFFESNSGEGSVTNNGVLPTSVSTEGGLFSVDFSAMRLGGEGEELRFNLLVDGALTGKSYRSFSDGNLVWNEVLDLAPGVHTIGIQSLNAAGSVGLFDADLDVIRYNAVPEPSILVVIAIASAILYGNFRRRRLLPEWVV